MTPTVTKNHALVGTSRIMVQIWEPVTETSDQHNGERVVDWKIFDEGQSIETAKVWGQLHVAEPSYHWIKLIVQEWREQTYDSNKQGNVLDAEVVDIKAQEGYADADGGFTWYERPVSEL